MARIRCSLLLLVAAIFLIAGCNWPLGENATLMDQSAIDTAVALTVQTEGGATAATNTRDAAASVTETPKPDVPEATATETHTPTITVTSTSSVPRIHSTVDTNCRYGPGVVYSVVGYLLATDSPVEVRGQLESGGWWYIQNLRYPTQSCWVWDDTTVVEGDTRYLPFITPPPTPTMTPTPRPVVSAWANPASYAGACPVTITIYATITVAGPTNITYQWDPSSGGSLGPLTINFASAGSQTVNIAFPVSVDISGWVALHILSPINIISNQATFIVNCVP
jgi:hypothetical protein